MSKSTYLQFPTYLLAFASSPAQRSDAILATSAELLGRAVLESATEAELQREWSDVLEEYTAGSSEAAMAIGFTRLGVTAQSLTPFVKLHQDARSFVEKVEERFGGSPSVRLKAEIFKKALFERSLSTRELQILIAIYSSIGDRSYPVRITNDMLAIRALGYKNRAMQEALLSERKDGMAPLTVSQVRTTVDALHRLNFFARATIGRRATYYSHRLTDDDLRTQLEVRLTRKAQFLAERAKKDQELTDRIQKIRLGIGVTPKSPAKRDDAGVGRPEMSGSKPEADRVSTG